MRSCFTWRAVQTYLFFLSWPFSDHPLTGSKQLIIVSGVCCLSLLRVYACVSCSISILFLYMYVHMPSSPRSIAGVPSSRALLGFPITAAPPVCIPDVIGALAVWIQNQKIIIYVTVPDPGLFTIIA